MPLSLRSQPRVLVVSLAAAVFAACSFPDHEFIPADEFEKLKDASAGFGGTGASGGFGGTGGSSGTDAGGGGVGIGGVGVGAGAVGAVGSSDPHAETRLARVRRRVARCRSTAPSMDGEDAT